MLTVFTTSADDALQSGLQTVIDNSPLVAESRNGPVLRARMPLTTTYVDPKSRVLFNPVRDCNPFLHLFESMWMLRGRRDLAFVSYFTPQMRSYSDDGVTLNGAYGWRWRYQFGIDQIDDFIVPELKANKDSRRAHLGMWDARNDPRSAQTGTKDVPCNLSIAFDVVENRLNMTVFNRSNDLVWGAYGANLVHMSFLQEYVAQSVGLMLGNYYQVSNNAHIYLENPVAQRLIQGDADTGYSLTEVFLGSTKIPQGLTVTPFLFDYTQEGRDLFYQDLVNLFHRFDSAGHLTGTFYASKFGTQVLDPMGKAYDLYKQDKLEDAVALLENHNRYDWLVNGKQWIERRIAARKAKAFQ